MTSPISSKSFDALTSAWPDAFSEFDPHTVGLICRLLESQTSPSDVAIEVQEGAGGGWRVGVCLADRLGSLAAVSGVLTANGLEIVEADSLTVAQATDTPSASAPFSRRSSPGARKRKASPSLGQRPSRHIRAQAVIIFNVQSRSGRNPDWSALKKDLEPISGLATSKLDGSANSAIVDRFAQAMHRSGRWVSGQIPTQIGTDNATSDEHTLLEIRSGDTPGFLFAFSTALSSVRVNIVRSRVRTVGGRVQDTFWLTEPSGGKLESGRRVRQVRTAAALIKQFMHLLPSAPDPGQALRQFNSLVSQILSRPDWTSDVTDLESPGVLETLAEMMGTSRFLWEDFLRLQHENLFPVLLDVPGLYQSRSREELTASIESLLTESVGRAERLKTLNQFKDREMFRIDLRFITGRIGRQQFGVELSTLAEVAVEKAFELAVEVTQARLGIPRLDDGSVCDWAIFGLGKFGGSDMGFGSDIELMFVYRAEGSTDGPLPVRTSTFFDDAVREFLRVIDTRQQRTFEVDLRLRPYGSKGALASTLGAVRAYYSHTGDARQFERLALVRMRPVAGDANLRHTVMDIRDSFVYSHEPIDVADIRHLRRRQSEELVQQGTDNVKFSPGGLVDIEYYVQAWQISRGGSDPGVRQTNTLDAVNTLRSRGHLDAALAKKIADAYDFLRAVVDALRVVRGNAKDLNIPSPDTSEFQHMAHRLSIHPPSVLSDHISEHMAVATNVWDELDPSATVA